MSIFGGGGGNNPFQGGEPEPGQIPPWWDASWGEYPWWLYGGNAPGGGGGASSGGDGGPDPNGPVIGTATGVANAPVNGPTYSTPGRGTPTPPGFSLTAGVGPSTPVASRPSDGAHNPPQQSPQAQNLLGLLIAPHLKPPPPGANALPGQLINQAGLDSQMNSQAQLQRLLQGILG